MPRTPKQFFFAHAVSSYAPATETRIQARWRNAANLARAEALARGFGYTFTWSIDPDVVSSDWSDELPAWPLWHCLVHDANGYCVASLHGIDFGRDGSPDGDPYARVVEAELAHEALTRAGAM